jgi:hypothetical protein
MQQIDEEIHNVIELRRIKDKTIEGLRNQAELTQKIRAGRERIDRLREKLPDANPYPTRTYKAGSVLYRADTAARPFAVKPDGTYFFFPEEDREYTRAYSKLLQDTYGRDTDVNIKRLQLTEDVDFMVPNHPSVYPKILGTARDYDDGSDEKLSLISSFGATGKERYSSHLPDKKSYRLFYRYDPKIRGTYVGPLPSGAGYFHPEITMKPSEMQRHRWLPDLHIPKDRADDFYTDAAYRRQIFDNGN